MSEPMRHIRWRLLQGGLIGCMTLAGIATAWLYLAPARPSVLTHAPGLSRPFDTQTSSLPSAFQQPTSSQQLEGGVYQKDGASLETAARDALFGLDGAGEAAAAAAPASPAEAAAAARWRVAGVALGEPPQAILEEVATHATRLVTRGQRVDEWTVEAIGGHRVVLRRQGVTTELSF